MRRREGRLTPSERAAAESHQRGSLLFRGWRWLCPVCDRRIKVLFCPLPPINVLRGYGCLIADRGELRNVPAFPVRSVDSTGAGDAFTAAFLQARLRGWPAPESALLANAVGAVAAGVVGAGDAAPTAKQVATLVRNSRLKREWETMRLRVLRRLSSGAQHRSAQSFDERKMRQKIS